MSLPPPEQPTSNQPDTAAESEVRLVEVAGHGQVNIREGVPAEATPPSRRAHAWTGRRLARILAFQVLYEMDVAHHAPGSVLQRFLEVDAELPFDPDNAEFVHGSVVPEAVEYARDLISGVLRHREEIDIVIQEKAPAWPLRQMSAVDRTILRLGLYECCHQHGMVPVKVAINEAIELAKLFGSESLPRFVNGVLGSVVASQSKTTR
jgi:N utilization substance protein B